MPPKAIADLVDAPLTPAVSVDPSGTWMLLMEQSALPSIEELSQPELRIAGLRINPRTTGPSRRGYFTGLSLMQMATGAKQQVSGLPVDARIGNPSWSPDGTRIAFTMAIDTGIELWIADMNTGQARRLMAEQLNAAYGQPFTWMFDSQHLICKIISGREDAPVAPTVPINGSPLKTCGDDKLYFFMLPSIMYGYEYF